MKKLLALLLAVATLTVSAQTNTSSTPNPTYKDTAGTTEPAGTSDAGLEASIRTAMVQAIKAGKASEVRDYATALLSMQAVEIQGPFLEIKRSFDAQVQTLPLMIKQGIKAAKEDKAQGPVDIVLMSWLSATNVTQATEISAKMPAAIKEEAKLSKARQEKADAEWKATLERDKKMMRN